MKSPTAAGTRNATGDRVSVGPGLGKTQALLERPDDRRAAVGLHGHHPRSSFVGEPAQCLELGERLPHADQSRAASGGIQNHVGEPPIELLGQLEPHRLFSFDAVRLLERGKIEPAHRRRSLRGRCGHNR